jgi:hypothetical protein
MVLNGAKSGNSNCRGSPETPSKSSTRTRLNRHFQLSPTGKNNCRYTIGNKDRPTSGRGTQQYHSGRGRPGPLLNSTGCMRCKQALPELWTVVGADSGGSPQD